jgi:hypothetical protein
MRRPARQQSSGTLWALALLGALAPAAAAPRASAAGSAGLPRAAGSAEAGAALHGCVRHPAGRPLSGYRLRIVGPGRSEQLELPDSGCYRLEGLGPGTYVAYASAPASEAPVLTEMLVVGAEDLEHDFVLPARSEAALSGVVTDPEDRPVPDATLRLTRRDGSFDVLVAETRSDERGRYRLAPVEPERYELWVEHPGYATRTRLLGLADGDEAEENVVLRRHGAVFGRVLRREGPLLADALLIVRGEGGELVLVAPVQHDATGTFELEGLEPGRYWLSASAPGLAPDTLAQPVTVGPDTAVRADFRLGTGGGLRVRVLTEEGEPAAALELTLERRVGGIPLPLPDPEPGASAGRARTDAAGEAGWSLLEPGEYLVRAAGTAAVLEIQIVEGRTSDLELRLP